jgi:Tol biopolymer transport system component
MLRFSSIACAFYVFFLLLALLIGRALPTERLVFLSDRDGLSKLYAIDIHRGVTHKLNDKELSSYAMSPDGQQILSLQPINDRAFAIFTISLNGSDVHQLVE